MTLFKIKKYEYINKTFRMPVELVKKMEIIAQDKQVSLNNLVTQCCEYALENIDIEDRSNDTGLQNSEELNYQKDGTNR